MSEDIAVAVGSKENNGENFQATLDCVMKIRYARILSIEDLQTRQQLADSYNFKADFIKNQFRLPVEYISVQTN